MRLLPFLAFLAACSDPSFVTDGGQLRVHAPAVDLAAEDGGPSAMLVGASNCFTFSPGPDAAVPEGPYALAHCYTQAVEGSADATFIEGDTGAGVETETCLDLRDTGEVAWTFTARSCALADAGYPVVDDAVTLGVVAHADVTGTLPHRLEESVEANEVDERVTVLRPDDWLPAASEPLRLVDGMPFRVQPRLRVNDDGRTVAWWDATLHAEGPGAAEADPARSDFIVRADASGPTTLLLEAGDGRVVVGEVVAVPESALASIELALVTYAADGLALPYAARAVVRDRDGNLVFGAPVRWRFTPLVVGTGTESGLPGTDYLSFGQECTDPAETYGEQRAVLTASIGLLSDSVEVVWTPRLEPQQSEGWERPEACQPPCGCASSGAAPAGLALFGALALLRRRSAGRLSVPPPEERGAAASRDSAADTSRCIRPVSA